MPVLDPYIFEIWENEKDMGLSTEAPYSITDFDYLFTCLIADAIRHVNRFFFTRKKLPSKSEKIGEFVTEIRRLLRSPQYYGLADQGFKNITNVDFWADVVVPSGYRWNFPLLTLEGTSRMSQQAAETLCNSAVKLARSDKTTEEEFLEINYTLNELAKESRELNTYINRAKELNIQAETVVGNLCVIATQFKGED